MTTKFKIPLEKRDEVCLTTSKVVADYLCNSSMLDKNRKRENVKARQITHYCLRELTSMSLADIGLRVGAKDHSTILHSCRAVTNDSMYPDFAWDVTLCLELSKVAIHKVLNTTDPNVALLKDNFIKLKSAINGNEFGQRALIFIENFIQERIPGYSI